MSYEGASSPSEQTGMHVVRCWDEIRSAHLEFLNQMHSSTVMYRKKNYSFDEMLTQGLDLRPAGLMDQYLYVLRSKDISLELNEPMLAKIWPRLFVFSTLIRLKKRLTPGSSVRLVFYAIDNCDWVQVVQSKLPLSENLVRKIGGPVMRWIFVSADAVAFGSNQSRDIYRRTIGPSMERVRTTVIPQLPQPCDCLGEPSGREWDVVFVGTFDERKGLPQLLVAWPKVLEVRPKARLAIIGDGPLLPEVRSFAASEPNVSFMVDPPRSEIHSVLRSSRVLTLLSQPRRAWREQIGLPILEGLSHGCRVVCSSETGLSDWLSSNGHLVLEPDSPASSYAEALLTAVDSPIVGEATLEVLPPVHGRVEADRWLHGAQS